MDLIVLVSTAILSVILCFFGIKLIRVCNGIAAAATGLGIGYYGAALAGLNWQVRWVVMAVAAIVLVVLTVIFKRFGVFLFCAVGVTGILMLVVRPENLLFYAVFGGIGMLFAIAAMRWMDAIYIFATSFVGGVGIGRLLFHFIPEQKLWIMVLIYLIPVLLGCVIQFVLKSREIGRREKKESEAARKENSMEEEVEQARMLFDEEAEEPKEDSHIE